MRKLALPLRLLFGVFWLVFGMNGFMHFFPVPAPRPEGLALMQALEAAGYVLPLVYGTQVICGLLLLLGSYVPVALALLGPVVANILLYDLFLNPPGLTIGVIILAVYLGLLYAYRRQFLPFLQRVA